MVQRYRKYHPDCPLHLLTMVQDDDVTTIDAIEMVDVEVERVVAMSTSLETQVRPISLIA